MTRAAFYLDLLERTGWTAAQTFLGSLFIDSFSRVDLTWGQRFALAGGAGGAAIAKGVIATNLPWTKSGSASTLPADAAP